MTIRGYVAGAMAVVLLVLVPLAVAAPALWDGPPTSGPGAPSYDVAGDAGVARAMRCDDPSVPAEDVPTSVVAARMCATDVGVMVWHAPQDSLHLDLHELVGLLDRLEPPPESTETERWFCTDDGGYGFDLRLALESGEVVSIPGDTGGCSTVRVGEEDLVGSDEVLALFLDRLAEQRTGTEPPDRLEELPLACGSDGPFGDHVVSRIGDPRDLVTAVSCWRPDGKDDVGPWRGPTAVPRGQVAALATDMRAHTRRDLGWHGEPCRDRPWWWQDLVGQTRWGDVVVVRGVCRTYLLSDVSSVAPDDQEFWYPSPRAQRVLDRLRR